MKSQIKILIHWITFLLLSFLPLQAKKQRAMKLTAQKVEQKVPKKKQKRQSAKKIEVPLTALEMGAFGAAIGIIFWSIATLGISLIVKEKNDMWEKGSLLRYGIILGSFAVMLVLFGLGGYIVGKIHEKRFKNTQKAFLYRASILSLLPILFSFLIPSFASQFFMGERRSSAVEKSNANDIWILTLVTPLMVLAYIWMAEWAYYRVKKRNDGALPPERKEYGWKGAMGYGITATTLFFVFMILLGQEKKEKETFGKLVVFFLSPIVGGILGLVSHWIYKVGVRDNPDFPIAFRDFSFAVLSAVGLLSLLYAFSIWNRIVFYVVAYVNVFAVFYAYTHIHAYQNYLVVHTHLKIKERKEAKKKALEERRKEILAGKE